VTEAGGAGGASPAGGALRAGAAVGGRAGRLGRGDLPPDVRVLPPGPRARGISRRLARAEAPGINTLAGPPGEEAPALLWAEARGANVLDVDGNRYVDLTSGFGVAAVGHRHPRVVAAVRRQAGRLLHGLGDVHAHPLRVELAERLAAVAPVRGRRGSLGAGEAGGVRGDRDGGGGGGREGGARDSTVYFGISGAEAVEIAAKTALLATGRPGVLAFDPGYHGLTLGALAATSRPEFRRPFAPWLHPHVERLPFGADPGRVAAVLGRGGTGCVLVEPIVGREGVVLPPPGWLAAVAAACREAGALLVADEVYTGFGRTGTLFAVEQLGEDGGPVEPDLLVCGKALGGGLPIAAVIGRRELFAGWRTGGEALHTATFVANPLACAAALAVLEVLAEERLVERAARLGRQVGACLAIWPERFAAVAEVRGRGLLWGIELRDRDAARRLVAEAAARGVLLLAGGPQGRVAQVVPPLTIAEEQLAGALDVLEVVLGADRVGRPPPAG